MGAVIYEYYKNAFDGRCEKYTFKACEFDSRQAKGGEYEVLYLAKDSETLETLVVYKALYGEGGIWVRPARMWNETVVRDGKTHKRFTFIE